MDDRRGSLQPTSHAKPIAADHLFHIRKTTTQEESPGNDLGMSDDQPLSTETMKTGASENYAPRRMSLPSLVGGVGMASSGLHHWHKKVLAKKVARSNEREEALRIAKAARIVVDHHKSLSAFQQQPEQRKKPYDSDSGDDSDSPDLREQGNLAFYTDESLLQREHLRYNVSILKTIDHWWYNLVLPIFDLDGDGNIQREEYSGLYKALLRALSTIFHLKQKGKAGRAAQHRLMRLEKREWESDSQGHGFIDKERFRRCVFELVDIWSDKISAKAYSDLCNRIFTTVENLEPKKKEKPKFPVGAPKFSKRKYGLQYRTFDILAEVLAREQQREIIKRKAKQSWGRGISRLSAHNTIRLMIQRLKNQNAASDSPEDSATSISSASGTANLPLERKGSPNIRAESTKKMVLGTEKGTESSSDAHADANSPVAAFALKAMLTSHFKTQKHKYHTTNRWERRDGESSRMKMSKSALLSMKSSSQMPGSSSRHSNENNPKRNKKLKRLRRRRPKSAITRSHVKGRFATISGSMQMRDIQKFNETNGRTGNHYKAHKLEYVRRKLDIERVLSIVGDNLRTHQAMSFVERQGGIQTNMTQFRKYGGGRGGAMLIKK